MSANLVIKSLRDRGWMIATAESCTGGLVAASITDVAGSSDVFDRGFVVYSYASKTELLGVSKQFLETHGAVNETVARAMAEGALAHSNANIAIAITGVAGPGGGSPDKPVGLVHFACATKSVTKHVEMRFGDLGRSAVRRACVAQAFQMVMDAL